MEGTTQVKIRKIKAKSSIDELRPLFSPTHTPKDSTTQTCLTSRVVITIIITLSGAQVVEWRCRPHTRRTPIQIPAGGPLLHITPPLSPPFLIYPLSKIKVKKCLKKKLKIIIPTLLNPVV